MKIVYIEKFSKNLYNLKRIEEKRHSLKKETQFSAHVFTL